MNGSIKTWIAGSPGAPGIQIRRRSCVVCLRWKDGWLAFVSLPLHFASWQRGAGAASAMCWRMVRRLVYASASSSFQGCFYCFFCEFLQDASRVSRMRVCALPGYRDAHYFWFISAQSCSKMRIDHERKGWRTRVSVYVNINFLPMSPSQCGDRNIFLALDLQRQRQQQQPVRQPLREVDAQRQGHVWFEAWFSICFIFLMHAIIIGGWESHEYLPIKMRWLARTGAKRRCAGWRCAD